MIIDYIQQLGLLDNNLFNDKGISVLILGSSHPNSINKCLNGTGIYRDIGSGSSEVLHSIRLQIPNISKMLQLGHIARHRHKKLLSFLLDKKKTTNF